MKVAVVVNRVLMTDDRHSHFSGQDGLVTVRHCKSHRREVGVVVSELVGGKTHIGGVVVRAACRNHTVDQIGIGSRSEGEVSSGIQVRAVRCVETADNVFLTIVQIVLTVARNGHCGSQRLDTLTTIVYHEVHIGEVIRVQVGEHILC